MSEVELKAQLDNANNQLRINNAKIMAANNSLGAAIAEIIDLKATNILFQESEKALMSKVQELQLKITALDQDLLVAHRKIEELEKQLEELKK